MTDFANLGIRIDSTEVKVGVSELDKLTVAGTKSEEAVNRLGVTSSQAGAQIRTASQSAADMAAQAQASATAARNVAAGMGAASGTGRVLSQQLSQVAQQAMAGGNVLQALAIQLPDIAAGMGAAGASAGRFASFMGGPWGMALTTAIGLTASLAAGHYAASKASDEQKNSAEDLEKALDDLHKSTIRETQSTYAAAQASMVAAQALRIRATEARKAAVAELELAKARAISSNEQAVGGRAQNYGGNYVAQNAERDVDSIQKRIDDLSKKIGTAEGDIRLQQGKIATALLEERFDKGAAASGKFAREQDRLNKELSAGRITIEQYASGINKAISTRERETESAKKSTKSHREKKAAITDEQRAYEQALRAANNFIESLEYEIEKIGKTPAQLRQLEIARAKEAAATDDQRKKIDALSAAREAALAKEAASKAASLRTDYERTTLQPLRDELALLGLTGEALSRKSEQQKLSALASEEESYKADLLAKGLTNVNGLWLEYYTLNADLIRGESVLERDKLAAEEFGNALRELQSIAGEFDFGAAFGTAGEALNNIIDSMDRLNAGQATYAKAIKAAGGDQVKIATATAAKKKLEVNETFALIGATKSLFKEKSAGYQMLGAIETAYAAVQLANTIKSIAPTVAKGAAKIFDQLGIFAFPVVGAMLAVMAGLGFGGGSSTSVAPPSSQDLQDAAGTGSVLGDTAAKSASIANALEIVAANSNRDLEYSNAMLKALRSIDTSISALAGNVARQISVSGSMFDTSRLKLGSSGSGGFLGIGASSTDRALYDLGINLNSGTVADIVNKGIAGSTYQIVQQIRKTSGFLGIGGGTKTTYQTTTGSIDASITQSISEVVASLRNGLLEAARTVGLEGAQALIDGFQVNLGKISFAGMTGQEIEDQLNAIFSKVGDDMAATIMPGLAAMQKIGEGLFETFVRVAREYQVVDMALKSIGMEFGAVGVASLKARDELVQLFGSLDDFAEATNFFRDNFLTEAEQIAPVALSVRNELERLGLAGVATREQFKSAVLGLDLTTTAGREMYSSLLAVAPAFDKVAKYAEAANKTMSDAFKKTVSEFQGYANNLTKYRDSLFAGPLSQGNAYEASRKAFLTTAGLAAEGNATGLAGLENAGKTFLEASKANATSLIAYQRDVAMVAGAVDKGIFAATETADYAQLQLDALNNSASILASIDTGIANVQTLLGGSPSTPATVAAPSAVAAPATTSSTSTSDALAADSKALLAEIKTIMMQTAENTNQLARLWSRLDGDGLLVRTDEDTPLQVQTV